MSGNTSKNKDEIGAAPPDWYAADLDHIWLPYAQMKSASPPLAVTATRGSRIANSSTAWRRGGPPVTAITTRISVPRSSAS